jgi:CO/xanthine dehydrogenase FAD-binding subunit
MITTQYVKADSIEEAVRLLNEPEIISRPLAGGTDLMVQRRINEPDYRRLIDISRISDLKIIKADNNQFIIGAGVTFSEVENNLGIKQNLYVLFQACSSVGSPQIRNVGTLGGNVANAAACADSLPAFVCLATIANLSSSKGIRQVFVSDLILGPHKTMIGKGEVITHFIIDLLPTHVRSHFIKIGRRNAQSISRLSIAAAGGINSQGEIDFIRICPGAATPKTTRFSNVEGLLIGKKPEESLFSEAGELSAKTMIEISGIRWSTQYKEIAIKALTERVLRNIFL